MESMQMSM